MDIWMDTLNFAFVVSIEKKDTIKLYYTVSHLISHEVIYVTLCYWYQKWTNICETLKPITWTECSDHVTWSTPLVWPNSISLKYRLITWQSMSRFSFSDLIERKWGHRHPFHTQQKESIQEVPKCKVVVWFVAVFPLQWPLPVLSHHIQKATVLLNANYIVILG